MKENFVNKNKIVVLIILVILIVSVIIGLMNRATQQKVEVKYVGNMKIPRYGHDLLVYNFNQENPNQRDEKVVAVGGIKSFSDRNSNNISAEAGEIIDLKTFESKLLKNNILNGNNNIYLPLRSEWKKGLRSALKYANVQVAPEGNNSEYGIEIFDLKNNTSILLKTKPFKRNIMLDKVAYKYVFSSSQLYLWGGTYYGTKKNIKELEIIDINKNEKKVYKINMPVNNGYLSSHSKYFLSHEYLLFGGKDINTNLPTKKIYMLNLKNNSIIESAELSESIASPMVHMPVVFGRTSSTSFDYLFIDKILKHIELVNGDDYKISEEILIPEELNTYNITGSIESLNNIYIIFENKLNTYLTKYNPYDKKIELIKNFSSRCYSPSYTYLYSDRKNFDKILFSGGLDLSSYAGSFVNISTGAYKACTDIGLIEVSQED